MKLHTYSYIQETGEQEQTHGSAGGTHSRCPRDAGPGGSTLEAARGPVSARGGDALDASLPRGSLQPA